MPAPTKLQIYLNVKQSLLAAGYWHKLYDKDGKLIEDPTRLMDEMDKLILAISEGLSNQWTQWQATQIIQGIAKVTTAPGTAPVTGTLP